MEFSDNVTVIERGDKTYYLIGTAHISPKSVEEVRQVIETVKPDTVCVELCKTRFQTLTQEDQWKKLNIMQVIKQGKALMLLANLALSSFQRKMGEKMGIKPGAELLEGVKQAEAVGAELVLADREIQTTLKRTWGNLSFLKKMMVLSGLFGSVLGDEELTEEELEKMKEKDHLSDMMAEFAKTFPDVKKPLIDERDHYLMSKIHGAPGEKIVAVVGAGHMSGICENFGNAVDLEALDQIPKPSPWTTALKWAIPSVVLLLFAYGFFRHRNEDFYEMLIAWVLPNAIGAGVFAIFAGAKFLTILIAAISAPITSLNPSIGVGMVAGFTEALLRKPTVEDSERLQEDIKTVKGFYRNRLTRVLLVFLFSSIGSVIGTWVGAGWMISIFSQQ